MRDLTRRLSGREIARERLPILRTLNRRKLDCQILNKVNLEENISGAVSDISTVKYHHAETLHGKCWDTIKV